VLQCASVCCSVLQCAAVCCSVLQCVTVCCSVLQCVAVCCMVLQGVAVCCSVLQCAAVCCSALQCVTVCGSVPVPPRPVTDESCLTAQSCHRHIYMCMWHDSATHCKTLQHTATKPSHATYTHVCVCVMPVVLLYHQGGMGWLQLVGFFKTIGLFCKRDL